MKLSIKSGFLILAILLFLNFVTSTAQYNEKIISEVTEVLIKQQDSWNRGNLLAYMQAYWNSDSLIFIGKSGPKYGWQTTLENYQKSYPDKSSMGTLKFTFIKFEVFTSKSCSVLGKWELKRENDSPSGYFSLILRNIHGKWLITSDHSS
jgi:hypothetical protein